MSAILVDVREAILPDKNSKDGPLPLLLLGLTLVTGMVDAFSYLSLGHIFVANMTGNVLFLGFALAGAPRFSVGSSIVALASFGLGALLGGRIGSRIGQHRGNLLATAAAIQALFLAVAVVLATLSGVPIATGYRYTLIAVVATGMGMQSATGRKLAIPNVNTNVLTMTLTGVAADNVIAGGRGSGVGRRLMSVAAMLIGAIVGAVFALRRDIVVLLALALLLTVVVAATAWRLGSANPAWVFVESGARSPRGS